MSARGVARIGQVFDPPARVRFVHHYAAFLVHSRNGKQRYRCRDCQRQFITRFYTDDRESYQKLIPSDRHWIGKMGTQRIERQNLNFHTHLKRLQRRTICFSKSREMHEAVIKLYINHRNAVQPLF